MEHAASVRRIQAVIDHFETIADAAATLGVDTRDLVRATGDGPSRHDAVGRVDAAIDGLDEAIAEAERGFPVGEHVTVALPGGAVVTALVQAIRPLEGTAWVELEVIGPGMFDVSASGCYRARDLTRSDSAVGMAR